MDRLKKIIKVSIQGILVNFVLVAFKAIVGFIANSISIILDAINNLSDALSSIITIIGTKLSNKRPDKKHPYGYGRIEYLTSIIIGVIVMVAGVSALRESIDKIINPTLANYSIASLIIIIVGVFIKFFFGQYVKRQGKKLNSLSLVASGSDATMDSILSFTTFVGAIISFIWKINIDGYLGILISLMIMKTAIEILKETVNNMIGVRADSDLTKKLKERIMMHDEVIGVYDLTLHNYGPNNIIATAHIQVKDKLTARDIHKITRKITLDIYENFGIVVTIGIYASNDKGKYKNIQKYIAKTIKEYPNIIQIHGFYVDEETNNISFDLIFNFEELEPEKIINEIKAKLANEYSEYTFSIILDKDYSD